MSKLHKAFLAQANGFFIISKKLLKSKLLKSKLLKFKIQTLIFIFLGKFLSDLVLHYQLNVKYAKILKEITFYDLKNVS